MLSEILLPNSYSQALFSMQDLSKELLEDLASSLHGAVEMLLICSCFNLIQLALEHVLLPS